MNRNYLKVSCVIFSVFTLLIVSFVGSLRVKATHECEDVLTVFARGSGQSKELNDQPQTKRFFDEIISRKPSSVDIETKILDYPAVNFQNFGNAELEWVPGFYRASVSQGVANLQKLIRDTVDQCPDQKLVLGGYSQGAQVVAETLQEIGSKYHPNIIYAGLFGDPKFDPDSFAARGTFLRRGGVLEPHAQDFPGVLEGRISSWCKRGDGVCENGSLGRVVGPFSAHNSYPDHEIPLAANEAATLLQTYFPDFETKTVIKEGAKFDVVLVFGVSAPYEETISKISNARKEITETVLGVTEDTRVGVVEFRLTEDTAFPSPRTLLELTSNKSAIRSGLLDIYPFGRSANENTLHSGLMEALNNQPWRKDANKAILYISRLGAENPASDTGYSRGDVIQTALDKGPIAIHAQIATDYQPFIKTHKPIVDATGGYFSFYPSKYRLDEYHDKDVDLYFDALDQLTLQPRALQSQDMFIGRPGEPTRINLAGSYDPDGILDSVEWDLDNDGTYDETTDNSLIRHVFPSAYEGNVLVRLTAKDGGKTVVKVPVSISSAHVLPTFPQSPHNLQISIQSGALRTTRSATSIVAARAVEQPATTTYTAELSWDPPADTGGAPVEGYTIYGNGEILGLVNADTTNVVIRGVPADADLSVAAVNKAGTGERSQPKTVQPPDTPERPPQPVPEEPDNTSNNMRDEPPATSPTNNEALSATPLQQQLQDDAVDDEKSQPALREPVTAGIVLGEAAGKEAADSSLTRLPYLVTVLAAIVSLLLSRHYYNKFYES